MNACVSHDAVETEGGTSKVILQSENTQHNSEVVLAVHNSYEHNTSTCVHSQCTGCERTGSLSMRATSDMLWTTSLSPAHNNRQAVKKQVRMHSVDTADTCLHNTYQPTGVHGINKSTKEGTIILHLNMYDTQCSQTHFLFL